VGFTAEIDNFLRAQSLKASHEDWMTLLSLKEFLQIISGKDKSAAKSNSLCLVVIEEFLGLFRELLLTSRRTKVVGLSFVVVCCCRLLLIDLHLANRVNRHASHLLVIVYLRASRALVLLHRLPNP